jgi:hypothetical protein
VRALGVLEEAAHPLALVVDDEEILRLWPDAFRDFGYEFELKAIRDQIGKGGDQRLPVFLTARRSTRKGRTWRSTGVIS